MSTLLAEQITAIATTALAVFAIATTFVAGMAFSKQSQEVTLLARQLDEQKKLGERQAAVLELQVKELAESLEERRVNRVQQRRSQAARVFMWEDRQYAGNVVTYVKNASMQPIYDAEVVWYTGPAVTGTETFNKPMMPGDERASTPMLSGVDVEDSATVHSVLWFRDAANIYWTARPDGVVEEVPVGKEPPRAT
jgi:hypothetical protein